MYVGVCVSSQVVLVPCWDNSGWLELANQQHAQMHFKTHSFQGIVCSSGFALDGPRFYLTVVRKIGVRTYSHFSYKITSVALFPGHLVNLKGVTGSNFLSAPGRGCESW